MGCIVDEITCKICGEPAMLKEAGLHPETDSPFRLYVCTNGHETVCYYQQERDGDGRPA